MTSETLAVLTSSDKKARLFEKVGYIFGSRVQHVQALTDLKEPEHRSPHNVATNKAKFFIESSTAQLTNLAPTIVACLVPDVLAFDMPDGYGSYSDADRILKKPYKGDDEVVAATDHFKKLAYATHNTVAYTPYVATVGIVPVVNGVCKKNETMSVWDSVWIGFSINLVRLLSNENCVRELVQDGVISPDVFSPNSICGIKVENLMKSVKSINGKFPNEDFFMTITYGRKNNIVVDDKSEMSRDKMARSLVGHVVNNVTLPLFSSIKKKVMMISN